MTTFRGFCFAIMACVGIACAMPSAFAAEPAKVADAARDFVDQIGGTALETLKNEDLSDDEKRAKLNRLFAEGVDIPYVARFVLGRYWRTATAQQQKDYLAAYEPFLIKNYVGRVAKYSGQTYKLIDSKPTDGGAVVGMVLHTPDGSAPDVIVNYRLNKVGDGFKVIDIMVEGVSLLNTQRSEFSSVVSNKGLDYLIDALRKKSSQ